MNTMAREIESTNIEPVSVDVTTPAFEAYAKFREDYENTAKLRSARQHE